jgi:PBP1b-binding outer membrane lipoprotein LpoB
MKKYHLVFLSAMLLLLSGCASVTSDIRVGAELAPGATIANNYKTYDWLGSFSLLNDPNNTWQPPDVNIAGDIKFLIDRELRKKGIQRAIDTPDLTVTFLVGVDMENQILKLDPDTKIELKKKIPKAALVVALMEVDSGDIVWLGVADAEIQKGVTAEVMRQRLDYAVREMFKLLP